MVRLLFSWTKPSVSSLKCSKLFCCNSLAVEITCNHHVSVLDWPWASFCKGTRIIWQCRCLASLTWSWSSILLHVHSKCIWERRSCKLSEEKRSTRSTMGLGIWHWDVASWHWDALRWSQNCSTFISMFQKFQPSSLVSWFRLAHTAESGVAVWLWGRSELHRTMPGASKHPGICPKDVCHSGYLELFQKQSRPSYAGLGCDGHHKSMS